MFGNHGCGPRFESVRSSFLGDLNFPIFSRGLRIRSTTKNQDARGFIKRPIYLGGREIQPGDVVRGDCDGVVVLPQSRIQEILTAAEQRADREREWLERLKAGATTLESDRPAVAAD